MVLTLFTLSPSLFASKRSGIMLEEIRITLSAEARYLQDAAVYLTIHACGLGPVYRTH